MTEQRVGPRRGYDLWGESYDATANPVVALDERVTPGYVEARPGERVLDAGCGTGRYFSRLLAGRSRVVGVDFSVGMLEVARRRDPAVPLVAADLQWTWPFCDGAFDAVLCALVGEHLDDLGPFCGEMARVLTAGGRAVFSVYHPAMAEAGKEAHFVKDGVDYRLGALRHSLDDYRSAFEGVGFVDITFSEHVGDEELASSVPGAEKYLGFPVLVVFGMSRDGYREF